MKVINKKKVKTTEGFLRKLSELSKEQKKDFIKKCHSTAITCLVEGCFNVLNNIHLKDNVKVKKGFEAIHEPMKKLCSRTTSMATKKRMLASNTGDLILNFLCSVLHPFLLQCLNEH